ncbi:hypothetical protein EMIT0196MI5_170066 [Pseudomonas sp. IT-196MI5]
MHARLKARSIYRALTLPSKTIEGFVMFYVPTLHLDHHTSDTGGAQ